MARAVCSLPYSFTVFRTLVLTDLTLLQPTDQLLDAQTQGIAALSVSQLTPPFLRFQLLLRLAKERHTLVSLCTLSWAPVLFPQSRHSASLCVLQYSLDFLDQTVKKYYVSTAPPTYPPLPESGPVNKVNWTFPPIICVQYVRIWQPNF